LRIGAVPPATSVPTRSRAAPDGYSLLINTDGIAIYPHLYSNLTYDVFRDLVAITFVADTPMVRAANPAVPATNLNELIALAKKEPNKLSFANPGLGTPHHLAFELFARHAGIEVRQATYRGGGPACRMSWPDTYNSVCSPWALSWGPSTQAA